MTNLQLKTRVAEETGLDLTTDNTMIQAWVNQAYRHVSGLFNWPWLITHDTVQTVADITTGTVSINAGSTALTFSSAPAASVANDYMIQFADSDDWYDIASHTAASTSATLADAYTGASNLSGGTYTLRKVYYSLPSDCSRIISLRQFRSDVKLSPVDMRTFHRELPDPTHTGEPECYYLDGLDSSNNWRLVFYPTPNATMNVSVHYLKRITELSADATEPIMPVEFHNVIVFGALAMYGHSFIDDTRVQEAGKRYNQVLTDMIKNSNPVPDRVTSKSPWFERSDTPSRLSYPSNYPR